MGFGPHKFDIGADMQSATVLGDGSPENNLQNKEQARVSLATMMANSNAGGLFLPLGLEPLTYQNGVSDGAGGWDRPKPPCC